MKGLSPLGGLAMPAPLLRTSRLFLEGSVKMDSSVVMFGSRGYVRRIKIKGKMKDRNSWAMLGGTWGIWPRKCKTG